VKRLPGYGINALLLEYEDAFPFRQYPFLAGPDAFTPTELREFLTAARGAGLTIIPLVQTYGHLEFALAHDELAHLREKPEIPSKICARKPQAVQFVKDLLSEVLAYHEDDRYVHLGADEVGHSGWCEACEQRIAEVGPVQMWADHEKPLLEWAIAQGKRPIVWDDVFWKDFESVATVGLPQGTVLHAWSYNITSLKPQKADASDLEFGGAGGVLKQVDVYRQAGFDSIAGPCYNWGVLFPRHTHCLRNTQVWAQKMSAAGMLGMLNTSWAVFHMPLQMLNLYVAATGALCRDPGVTPDATWQEQWLEGEFGGPADGVSEALEILGEQWEIPCPAYGRPFTPLVYGYMNMVFHYPGRQRDRFWRGAYPHDWDEIDFVAMYRTGVEESRKYPERDTILKALDEKLAAYPGAVAVMEAMATGATRHRDEAAMMAVLAKLKYGSLRVFAHLMRGDGSAEALLGELTLLEAPLKKVLAQAWDPVGQARMWRAFYEPMVRALERSV
jgi:hypothetical protein